MQLTWQHPSALCSSTALSSDAQKVGIINFLGILDAQRDADDAQAHPLRFAPPTDPKSCILGTLAPCLL